MSKPFDPFAEIDQRFAEFDRHFDQLEKVCGFGDFIPSGFTMPRMPEGFRQFRQFTTAPAPARRPPCLYCTTQATAGTNCPNCGAPYPVE